MNFKKIELVLAEMRGAHHADGTQLRDWEARIGEAITEMLLSEIETSLNMPTLATEPGGHDWE
ncbi:hypothetical protein LVB87_09475 [Lysobacter sp. KIS68-7]|uniref:hypothetical protein n=1 Tax=Lysobacter sp. KIS68-7 TaxID=2904252 RepID=UPI001E4F11FB|nr:hypothetical protein [Lysobacter sp. KIS68-7]UHQ18444.1 hypothetical protein LVB87_09475 [Lysobacter sp. KIS68-7]